MLTDEKYRQLAQGIVSAYTATGCGLTEGTRKVASDLMLEPNETTRLVEHVNTTAHLVLFDKMAGADDRYVTFNVVDPRDLMTSLYGQANTPSTPSVKVAAESYEPRNVYAFEDMLQGAYMDKVAAYEASLEKSAEVAPPEAPVFVKTARMEGDMSDLAVTLRGRFDGAARALTSRKSSTKLSSVAHLAHVDGGFDLELLARLKTSGHITGDEDMHEGQYVNADPACLKLANAVVESYRSLSDVETALAFLQSK